MRKLAKAVSALLTVVMLMGVVLCAPFTASAEETLTYGDYEYTLINDGMAEITKYIGSDNDVIIPSDINGNSVDVIGKFAFMGSQKLQSVIIPESITQISYGAFANCINLNSVTIDESDEKWLTIKRFAFYECPNLRSIKIPERATVNSWSLGYNYGEFSDIKAEDFTIYGYTNSNAELYAVKNEFKFISIGLLTAEKPQGEIIGPPGGDNYYYNLDEIYENRGLNVEFYTCDEFGNKENTIGNYKINRYFSSDNSGWYYQGCCENVDISNGCIKKIKDGNGNELYFNGSSSASGSGWGTTGMKDYIIVEVSPLTANVTVTLKLPEDSEYYEIAQDFDILTYCFNDKIPGNQSPYYIYDGTPKTPGAKFFGKDGTPYELVEDKDYTLTCTNNVNAGTATATIQGLGIYAGTTVIKNFTINKADQELLASMATTNLKYGETSQIVAIGEGNITYSSSDESVAEVSYTGVVKAVGEGYTVITINAAGNNNYNSATEKIMVFVSGNANPTEPTTKPDKTIGDINFDGKVTITDVTMLQKYLAGLDTLSNEQLAVADTNDDGSFTVDDATLIQKYIAGLVTSLG